MDNKWKRWTKEESDFLRKNYKKMKYREVAKALGRPLQGIQYQINQDSSLRKKEEKNRKDFITEEELRKMYSEDKMTIEGIAKKLSVGSVSIFRLLNDYGIETRPLGSKNGIPKSKKVINDDFAYLLGVLYGDGCIRTKKGKNTFSFKLKCKDADFAEKFKTTLERWSGLEIPKIGKEINEYGSEMSIVDKTSRDFDIFYDFDKEDLIVFSDSQKYNFIRGFADSEGHLRFNPKYRNKTVTLYNTNLRLLEIIHGMLDSIGIFSKIYLHSKKGTCGGTLRKKAISTKDCYTLMISRKVDLMSFYKNIGFTIGRKQERLKMAVESYLN
jgi:intein-encoded DNA endonuclease-like protein